MVLFSLFWGPSLLCNAGFLQWFSLAEALNYKVSEILRSDQQFARTVLPSTNNLGIDSKYQYQSLLAINNNCTK